MVELTLRHLPLTALVLILGALLVSGTVKGGLGIGLPLTAIPLLTQVTDLQVAIALLTVPLFLSNASQAVRGGRTLNVTLGLLPIVAPLLVGVALGVRLVVSLNQKVVLGFAGTILLASVGFLVAAPRLKISNRLDGWLAPGIGLLSGVMGGFSALYGPPLISYMIARGLKQDEFVKQISILFTAAGLAMIVAFGGFGGMTANDFLISLFAMAPTYLGMLVGERMRGIVPPHLFRNLVLLVVLMSAIQMLTKSLS